MSKFKKCKDCKWCRPDKLPVFWFTKARWEYATCRHPKSKRIEDIHMGGKEKYLYCSTAREWGPCEKDALLFEPKRG